MADDDMADDMAPLMTALFAAAQLRADIGRAMAAAKTDRSARFFTYVLLLQHGRLYVGSTDNPYMRLADHWDGGAAAAVWVREWGPPVRVVEMSRNARADDETYKVLEYADKFGWDNVRGGPWCRSSMSRAPSTPFERDDRRFEYLTRAEIDALLVGVQRVRS